MASGRRRGFALASAACVPVLVLGTAWLFVAGDKGTAIAGVLAVPLAALPLMAWFFDWKSPGARPEPEELWPVCLKLRDQIEPLEAEARNWFLAEHGSEGAPADVEFTRYRPKDPGRELVSWRSDGGAGPGTLAGIARFYTTLNKGRLVVLGAPGAGKTVLANELLLGLIKALPLQDPGPRTKVRVPVRLSLASFDPGNDAEETWDGELAERLEAWIARQLSTTYKLTPSTAQRLVTEGRILPILDGLDEMDAEGQVPDRARAVVRALNHPADHGVPPVVVVCREARYRQLAGRHPESGELDVLQDATVVELQPLAVEEVTGYITRRFPDGPDDPRSALPRWRPVIAYLGENPNGPLADALRTPLSLFLAVAGFQQPDTHPDTLIGLSAEALDQTLFDRLIPAVCRQRPRQGERRYRPEEVTRWLRTLADHLHAQGARGGSPSDIDLHLLWPAAGPRAPRYLTAALTTTAVVAPVLAFAGWRVLSTGHWQLLPHSWGLSS